MWNKGKKHTDLTFIAVAYDGSGNMPNFEAADTFWSYYLEGNRVKKRQLLSLTTKNTDDLIAQFRASMFDVIICRNFGPKAMYQLKQVGLRLFTFNGGSAAAVSAFRRGELQEL